MKTLSLEINELNFNLLEQYCPDAGLQNFQNLIKAHGIRETMAEKRAHELEPWIQWVTVHTGLSLQEHGIVRLGDIVGTKVTQVWERLQDEHAIASVAIAPLNAENRIASPSVFVPDPWTNTKVTAPLPYRWLHQAIGQVVNDNSKGRITLGSYMRLAVGALFCLRLPSIPMLFSLLIGSRRASWKKPLLMDVILANALVSSIKRGSYGFASLFLNAGAHIQHHFWYASRHYQGGQKNPAWYHDGKSDPLLDAYKTYDWVLGFIMRELPGWRIVLSTGMSQVPNLKNTCYYRLHDHAGFFRDLGLTGISVLPRASRDLIIEGDSVAAIADVAALVSSLMVQPANTPLFNVENRGDSLFCSVAYTADIKGDESVWLGETRNLGPFLDHFIRHSIENAVHRPVGYMIDTGIAANDQASERMPLADMCNHLVNAALS